MPKEAFYFSHDSNARQDEKILKLRAKHGWKGYGIYWAIIEMLRDATNYELETDYNLLAFELRCDEDILHSIINDFKLFIVNSTFYSSSLKHRMELKEEKSLKAQKAANKRWAKQKQSNSNANAMQTHSERNAIKEKKEKKENEISSKNGQPSNDAHESDPISINLDFTQDKFETEQANKAWLDWLEYRYLENEPINKARQPYVKQDLIKCATIEGELKEELIPKIVKRCIASGWRNIQLTDEMKVKIKQWQIQ